MKSHLLYPDRDFNPEWGMLRRSPSPQRWLNRDYDKMWACFPEYMQMTVQDLELDILFQSMACGDKFLFEVAKNVFFTTETDIETILYRQDILRDCTANSEVVREIYRIVVDLIEEYLSGLNWYSGKTADSVRSTSVHALGLFTDAFLELKKIAGEHADRFQSGGFKEFFSMLERETSDEYISSLKEKFEELSFKNGIFTNVELGKGNKGINYTLQKNRMIKKPGWLSGFLSTGSPSQYSFCIADRDIAGFRTLAEIKGRSMSSVSGILLNSSDHIFSFFISLKTELAFYIGCLNLRDRLISIGSPLSFPVPAEHGGRDFSFKELYDVCLALQKGEKVTGNDVEAEDIDLIIITGANRGGKSTFLRSIGVAQLMMQCGSFVPAESFRSNICTGIYTHFQRGEDHDMKSGKYDEELRRMSEIVDHLKPGGLVLFNESFAATNEREGSEISRQIVCALLKRRIKVAFVTHLYDFSQSLYEKNMDNSLFLRAERKNSGERTFRMKEGEPLRTSYGRDLYEKIFHESPLPVSFEDRK
ncbi:MAG: hypothetical protein JW931_05110 [Methanomicrobiaceae archaeon]|nr:hypothetical protein [Methanomicrobiaceae archaeon]